MEEMLCAARNPAAVRVVLEQDPGKHSPCWATWEIVPCIIQGYKQEGVSLTEEPDLRQEKD